MKNLFAVILLFCALTVHAENNVVLKFNHLLDGKEFKAGEIHTSIDGKSVFTYKLLRYYISNFKITHDGGKVLEVKDVYHLVNVATTGITMEDNSKFSLGKLDVNSIEAIEFAVGIDSATNHLDPSLYPSYNPLSLQSPTMHWGWAAGYRFVALEGLSGSNAASATNEFQIHSLGDNLYTVVKVNVKGQFTDDNTVSVTLDGEYKNLLTDIDVSTGLIEHGSNGAPAEMMWNIGNKVFTAAAVNAVQEQSQLNSIAIYPNPACDQLIVSSDENIDAQITVTNTVGAEVMNTNVMGGNISLPINFPSGVYGVRMMKNGKVIARNTISVVR